MPLIFHVMFCIITLRFLVYFYLAPDPRLNHHQPHQQTGEGQHKEQKISSLTMFLGSALLGEILISQRSLQSPVMFNVHRLTLRQQLEMQRNTSTVIAASCGGAHNAAALLTASQEEFPRGMYSETFLWWGQTK